MCSKRRRMTRVEPEPPSQQPQDHTPLPGFHLNRQLSPQQLQNQLLSTDGRCPRLFTVIRLTFLLVFQTGALKRCSHTGFPFPKFRFPISQGQNRNNAMCWDSTHFVSVSLFPFPNFPNTKNRKFNFWEMGKRKLGNGNLVCLHSNSTDPTLAMMSFSNARPSTSLFPLCFGALAQNVEALLWRM